MNTVVNNSFITCPKCSRMHETRVLVCENAKCAFTHIKEEIAKLEEVIPPVSPAPAVHITVDPIAKSVEVQVTADIGLVDQTSLAACDCAAEVTPADPVEVPGTAP